MQRARAHSSLIRGVVSLGVLAVGCNAILGNEERSLVEINGGGTSGAGGTESATGSGGTLAGGSGGTASETGGAGGTDGTGAVGAAGAAGAEQGGAEGTGAASSSTGAGGSSGATSSTGTGGSGGTSDCECEPGDSKSKKEPCGNCGSATVTKVCGEDCRWGEFGEQGECMNQGVCAPNEAGEQLLHCPGGRWRYSRSTCGSTCQWGAWTETACEGPEVCEGCACIAWCTDPDTGGTTCKWIGCSEAEARAECMTDVTAPDVSCTFKEPFTFLEWLPD